MRDQLRKCEYFTQGILPEDQREGPEDKGHFTKEGVGYFHAWGVDFFEFECGPANHTVAIVEDEQTGQVYKCSPEDVKFIN